MRTHNTGPQRLTPTDHSDALDQLGCKRYCCRRMVMTHVDLIEKLLKYVYTSRLAAILTRSWISDAGDQVHARRSQLQEDRDADAQPGVERPSRSSSLYAYTALEKGGYVFFWRFHDSPSAACMAGKVSSLGWRETASRLILLGRRRIGAGSMAHLARARRPRKYLQSDMETVSLGWRLGPTA